MLGNSTLTTPETLPGVLRGGKHITFSDQGEVDPKGFEEPVRAWAVAWDA